MQEGNFRNNHQMVAKATPFLDDQNGVPNTEEILSHNREATLFATPYGPMSNELDIMTNNIQASIPNLIEDNPGIQINSNKTPENAAQGPSSKGPQAPAREHELHMPIANVVRIMRRALPPHAKVADEAKETVQECVSEFISFITSEANESCQLEHRKTITAEDVIGAMSRLGFDEYVQPLTLYLQKHRESETYPLNPRRSVGNMGTEATAVPPKTPVLPPYTLIHPQFTMFNSGTYHDGSGTSTGPITMGQGLNTAATARNGTGPNLALGIGGGSNGNDSGGPSGSSRVGLDSYSPYGHYK